MSYILQIFKVDPVSGSKELFKEISYAFVSGTEMMDILYGARHFGIAEYFNLPLENQYDMTFK
jgi:hypothetical protein